MGHRQGCRGGCVAPAWLHRPPLEAGAPSYTRPHTPPAPTPAPAAPCSFTPSLFPPYVDADTLKATAPITRCDDPRLSPANAAACLRCAAAKHKDACLGTTSTVFYEVGACPGRAGWQRGRLGRPPAVRPRGLPPLPQCAHARPRPAADRESCTWVGDDDGDKVFRRSIGINLPYQTAYWMGAGLGGGRWAGRAGSRDGLGGQAGGRLGGQGGGARRGGGRARLRGARG